MRTFAIVTAQRAVRAAFSCALFQSTTMRPDEKLTAFLELEAETTKRKFVVFNGFDGTLFRYFKDAA
jgi:hypothetical protein